MDYSIDELERKCPDCGVRAAATGYDYMKLLKHQKGHHCRSSYVSSHRAQRFFLILALEHNQIATITLITTLILTLFLLRHT